ncbi:MAG: magnesium transporter [Candidatus Aenigmatarchaeota archaeon]
MVKTENGKDRLPSEVAKKIEKMNLEVRLKILNSLKENALLDILPELSASTKKEFFSSINKSKAAEILNKLPLDETIEILHSLDAQTREEILNNIAEEKREYYLRILRYGPKSAASIMTNQFISLNWDLSCVDAIRILRKKRIKYPIYYIYVVDDENHLIGVVSLRQLVLSHPKKKLKDIARRNVLKAYPETSREEVARIVRENNLYALPIVDNDNKLLGIVTVDDVLEVMEKETHEDISLLSGSMPLENVISAKTSLIIKARLPALIIGFFGALIASMIVGGFEDVLTKYLPLAFFMPLLVYMSDATGTQTEATTIRTLALDPNVSFGKYFSKQFKTGIALGFIVGLFAYIIIGFIWGFEYGLVAGVSTFISMNFSNTLTSSLPFLYKRLGLDPAALSGPIDTIISDITTLIIYFLVAHLLLSI